MQQKKQQLSTTKINLIVDSVIFIAFLIVMAPHFTGMAIHEWLGLAFGAGIVTHLLLHWQWLVATTKRLFSQAPRQARINYALNLLLFIDITLVVFTGVMISESALPFLGISFAPGGIWRMVHTTAADLSLGLIGLHVALHWQWIVNAVRNYVIKPVGSRVHLPQAMPQYTAKLSLAAKQLPKER
ncbi:MAG: DUF4405 domain-containing protein [Chloroflexi bacterium]|nr:DUF4405 domain-containing protein [Chloroflexota bacterium]